MDFAAQRESLLKGREGREDERDANRECLRGDPSEKGGIKTREEYLKEQIARQAVEQEAREVELMKNPEYRKQALARQAEEDRERDKAAFAKDAGDRQRRMELKKRQLAPGESSKLAAGKAVKKSRMSFDEDEEDADSE